MPQTIVRLINQTKKINRIKLNPKQMHLLYYRSKKKTLLSLFFIFSFAITSLAAYLENIPTVVKNPDGTVINCFSSGDEYFSFLHDSDGFTIIIGNDGYYYYGVEKDGLVIPSEHRVNEVFPKSIGLKPNALISEDEYKKRVSAFWEDAPDNHSKAPHTGQINNIVIYIRFSDDTEFTSLRSVFDNRFNNPSSQSLKHYFQEVSYGQLTIDSYHYPIAELTTNLSYQDIEPRSYFQPFNATTNPNGYSGDTQRRIREHGLLQRAVVALESQIPTSLIIDADGDNYVDNVCFIIRGNAEGWSDLLWAHRWVLYTYHVTIHGKRVYDYTFQPENQSGTYTLAHEMFHTLGAPDLYRYTTSGYTPVGPWDLMASNLVHMGAYMKWKYANGNWISSIPVISEPGVYTLNPLASSTNNAYRINTPNSTNQFYVVEYRRKTGAYEANVPQTGLLVYRINTSVLNGNASGPPDEVYIYRPGGTTALDGNINAAAYSATLGRTSITDETSPSGFLSNGSPGGLEITNITAGGATISFTLFESILDESKPKNFVAQPVDPYSIELTWQKNPQGKDVLIAVSDTDEIGDPINESIYEVGEYIPGGSLVIYKGGDEEFLHSELDVNAKYHYKIWSINDGLQYSTGATAEATTLCEILSHPVFEGFNQSTALPTCWEVIDNTGGTKSWRIGTFANGISGADGNYIYINSFSYGSGSTVNTDIITPQIDLTGFEDVNISFKHYYRHRNGSSALLYYSKDNGSSWELITNWNSTISNFEIFSQTIPDLANQSQVRLRWKYVSNDIGYYWSIDDINISSITSSNIIQNSKFSVHPNPFTEKLELHKISNAKLVTIYNMLGQKVLGVELLGEDSVSLNTSSLPSGLYILSVFYDNGRLETVKIVK